MRFLKSLFAKKKLTPSRVLEKPQQLQNGDIFCFSDSFALPEIMRKQQLQVNEVNTVEFSHEYYARLITQGTQNQLVYISFPKNPHHFIKCSLLLNRAEVDMLFDLDEFSDIFDAPGKARLRPLTKDHAYGDILATEYIQQDFETSGYIHQSDYRHSKPPQYTDEEHGREFQYFSLEGDQGLRLIDIFIFENGDTDVYLSSLRPSNDITELWIKGE